MLEKNKIADAFSIWGFKEEGKIGKQLYGSCPFCEKEKKFYINEGNALWDCKRCGESGNYQQFLEKVSKRNSQLIKDEDWQELCKDRGLPRLAFKNTGIGRWGQTYSVPIHDENGKLQDLRRFKTGQKMRASIGCNIGLWNLPQLAQPTARPTPVYLCEGEWDGIALRWLLRVLEKPGVVVAVPGAGIFKQEWFQYFEKKEVFVCYDKDEAGEQGEISVSRKLSGVARSVQYLHWPGGLPTGFDMRDMIRIHAVKKNRPRRTYKKIHAMFKPFPRTKQEEKVDGEYSKEKKDTQGDPVKTTIEQVFEKFKKWLYLKNTDGIEMMLATVIANKIEGDPIWIFLVAPPGSAKTEIIQSLSLCEQVYAVSSLTPKSLISGSNWQNGSDPSLIPKIKNKVLGIKDFTTIMEMRENEREEIFGILRDSYDGTCVKVFGNGVKRTYESRFGIIAGVTPVIYHLDAQNQSLGERFLKFSIETNLKHVSEDEIISRAITNINKETSMRAEIAETVRDFVNWKYFEMEQKGTLPTIPPDIEKKIIALARFGSRMRGTVSRDKYRSEMINSRPSSEIGSRLGKQIAKETKALAIVNGRDVVNEHDYLLIKKCMLDTVSQKMEDIIRCLYEKCPTEHDSATTKMISAETKYPQSTVSRALADMFMLEIVKRVGVSNKYEWNISPYMRDTIRLANIYGDPEDWNRKKIRVKRKKVKI